MFTRYAQTKSDLSTVNLASPLLDPDFLPPLPFILLNRIFGLVVLRRQSSQIEGSIQLGETEIIPRQLREFHTETLNLTQSPSYALHPPPPPILSLFAPSLCFDSGAEFGLRRLEESEFA